MSDRRQAQDAQQRFVRNVADAIELLRMRRQVAWGEHAHPDGKRFTQQELTDVVYKAYRNMLLGRTRRIPSRSDLLSVAEYLECTTEETNALLFTAQYLPQEDAAHVVATESIGDSYFGDILHVFVEQMEDDSGSIWLYHEQRRVSTFYLSYENGRTLRASDERLHWTDPQTIGNAWDVQYMPQLQARRVLIHDIQEIAQSPAYAPYRQRLARFGTQTVLIVPLVWGETICGYMSSRCARPKQYSAAMINLTHVLACHVALAMQFMRLGQRVL